MFLKIQNTKIVKITVKLYLNSQISRKLIGCDRCLKDLGCEIEKRADGELQAFYQCEHGLLPFGDETEDCACQSKFYKRQNVESITTNPLFSGQNMDSQPTEFDGEAT